MGELGIDGCDSKVPTEVGKLLTLSGDIWSYVRTQKGAWGALGALGIDHGMIRDRLRIDPGSILDRSWIDPGSILNQPWVDPGST